MKRRESETASFIKQLDRESKSDYLHCATNVTMAPWGAHSSLSPYRISRPMSITSNVSLSGQLAACFLAHLKYMDKHSGLCALLSITLFLTSFKGSAHGLKFTGFGFLPGYFPLQVFAFEVGESAPVGAPGRAGPGVG